MNSPFQFGKIVSGEAFTDRIEQLKALSENLLSSVSTIIISPRRLGKSSLIKKCMVENFQVRNNYRVIMIDLFKIRDEHEFLETIARESIKCASNRIEDILNNAKDYFKNIIPKISFSSDSINSFSLSFDLRELERKRSEILDLPEKIAAAKNIKIIICIDEFQNIHNYDNSAALQKELRSSWQSHANVTYCLYGSRRNMMNSIFNDSNSPFYRFGAVIFLGRIEKKYWVPFISEAFNRTGKKISADYCGEIADSMKNHPYYVQQLSHLVWSQTKIKVDSGNISDAKELIINLNKPFFIREYESLSRSQINLMKAVCLGEKHFNTAENLLTYKLGTSGNVSKNKKVLESLDLIGIEGAEISFIDPVFQLWFSQYIIS